MCGVVVGGGGCVNYHLAIYRLRCGTARNLQVRMWLERSRVVPYDVRSEWIIICNACKVKINQTTKQIKNKQTKANMQT